MFTGCVNMLCKPTGCWVTIIITWRRSSKNRRKLERKKYSLKEGSRHEDVALMYAMGDILTAADKIQGKEAGTTLV